MNLFETQKRTKERETIEYIASQSSPSIIETGEETLTKFFSGRPYDKEDITNCVKNLLSKYKHDFDQQFAVLENIQKFNEVFENFNVERKKPFFVVFGKSMKVWVLFCLIHDKNGAIKMLYKDSSGAKMPRKLEDKIKEKIPQIEIVVQNIKDQDKEDNYLYGPLCLRNLKIMLDCLKKDAETFIKNFSKVEFCLPSAVNEDKFNNVSTLTNELSKNKEFKIQLKEFIDRLPLEFGSGILEYKKVMEEELEKDEEDVDMNKIKEAREKYLKKETIDKFQNDYKLNKKEVDQKVKEYELDIQLEFPEEMKKLTKIFQFLDDIKVDSQFYRALITISEILGIDYNKMKLFYELKAQKEDKNEDEKLSPDNINNIAENLPTMKESAQTDFTPLEQLLAEITLGMDGEDLSSPQHSQEDIQDLKRKYHLVKNKYENWKNSDIYAINKWAEKIKGHLGVTDDIICETIAIMDRALNLLTGGHRLRDTQTLAVLIFFHGQNNQGRLCQIKTGEGKTVIVSLLAVIRALQGHTVDVITSNPLLADDGVDETKKFYSTFNLTVSTNNVGQSSKNDFKIGYNADVLYGTISTFQFDYLKDTFEGFNIRNERRFGQVILDEVDSMLVDNGGHIAKLASPYPGMECLKYIYIKIWQELHKAEESFVEETQARIKEILKKNPDAAETKMKYEHFLQDVIMNERKIIKEKIRASNPTDCPLVPAHLKEYVKNKLEVWIKNALHAKYNCHEHQQYRIVTNDAGEKVVTPVDYLNTGITLKNTIWSNGLHQFVQLKHNLHLTFESLTSSFISNIGYIKNYSDKFIFGLTGTLGSRAEQELLSNIYNINYAKLPTYKQKKFEEIQGMIAGDSFWHILLTVEVIEKIDEGRAVLVICETEQDLLTVNKNLQILQNADFRIRIFANEDNAEETDEKVKIGDIILATNIAGRGTNFKTEKDLEANGGLHVCVGFLPCNLRVEGQAFGRTSRQGNSGTAQLIIRQSEVDELGIMEENPNFSIIRQERDRLEKERLKDIKNILVRELHFKDELFDCFSEYHTHLKQRKLTKKYMFVLQDLKEFWAFWLEKKNFKGKNLGSTTPKEEFDSFIAEAQNIIHGNIQHNPFYRIALADHYLEKDEKAKATDELNRAINMNRDENFDLLAGAHLKLFEIAIADGSQLLQRLKKAMANLFFIDVKKKEDYKHEALKHLNHAKAAVGKEIDYINKYLTADEKTGNPDFEKILKQNEVKNSFLKHIYSRLCCLKLHETNIEYLIETIQAFQGGLDLDGKAETTLNNLDKMDKKIKWSEYITTSEMQELHSVGLDAIYSLKEIHDVPDTVIHAAQGQILGGIAALVVGLCFPPVFPIMSPIAGTLISEGVMDIVMELISQGRSEFDQKDYMKNKFISYGVFLITFGLSAISQSVKILSKAVAYCRRFATFLRKSLYLKTLCNKLASLVDKLGDILEGFLIIAKFNKLSKAEQLDELIRLQQTGSWDKFQHLGGFNKLAELDELRKIGKLRELTRGELLVDFMKKVGLKKAENTIKSIAEEKVIKPLITMAFEGLTDQIKDHFKNLLNKSIREKHDLMEKLRTTPTKIIDEAVEKFNEDDEVAEGVKDFAFEILGKLNNTVIDALTLTYDAIAAAEEFNTYASHSISYLEQTLQGGDKDNNVDLIIEQICTKFSDKMFASLCEIFKSVLSGGKQAGGVYFKQNLKKIGEGWRIVPSPNKSEEKSARTTSTVKKEDPYSVLGLPSNSSIADVKKAYRILIIETHPDKNPNDPSAAAKMKEINNAFDEIQKSDQNSNN